MRTAEDVKRDPQPGDVVMVTHWLLGPFTWECVSRHSVVKYRMVLQQEKRTVNGERDVEEWALRAENAEVIHIAQEA